MTTYLMSVPGGPPAAAPSPSIQRLGQKVARDLSYKLGFRLIYRRSGLPREALARVVSGEVDFAFEPGGPKGERTALSIYVSESADVEELVKRWRQALRWNTRREVQLAFVHIVRFQRARAVFLNPPRVVSFKPTKPFPPVRLPSKPNPPKK